jgi:tagatose 6-phosphate kinase
MGIIQKALPAIKKGKDMITTVTLNTSIDKAYVVDRLNKGEVMRVKQCTNTPGGKGLNVARVVKLCGEEVLATGIAGGFSGSYVEDMLKKQQVPCVFTHAAAETRSCINILESDGTSTELLEAGEPITQSELAEFFRKFKQLIDRSDVVTISGSMPKGVDTNVYAKLIKLVKDKKKKVILDTSGEYLKEGIKACPTMIKPNSDEIEALLGVPVKNREEIIAGAKKLQSLGIEMVVVSLGADGALVVTEDGVYHGKPPKLETVNTVGSGDSMVAALAVGLARGYDVEEALRYAVSVSAANTLTMTTGNFKEDDRKDIYEKVTVTRLS